MFYKSDLAGSVVGLRHTAPVQSVSLASFTAQGERADSLPRPPAHPGRVHTSPGTVK